MRLVDLNAGFWLCLALAGAGLMVFSWILMKPVRGVYLATLLLPVLKTVELPVVGEQLTIVEPVVAATVFAWCALVLFGRSDIRRLGHQYVLIGLFLLACFLSLLNTRSMRLSVLELATYAYLSVLFFVVTQLVRTKADVRALERMWILTLVLVVLFGWVGIAQQALGLSSVFAEASGRVTSLLRKTNQLHSFLVVPLPMVCLQVFDGHNRPGVRWAAGLLALAAISVMLATGSRTVLVLLAALGSLLLLYRRSLARSLPIVVIGLAVVVIARALVLEGRSAGAPRLDRALSVVRLSEWQEEPAAGKLLDLYMRDFGTYAEPRGLALILARMSPPRYFMLLAWRQAIREHPLVGIGVGDFHDYFQYVYPPGQAHEFHNTYLGVWAEEGLLGFVALVVTLVLVGREAWLAMHLRDPLLRRMGVGLSMGFVLSLIYWLTGFGLRQRHFWMTAAQLVAIAAMGRQGACGSSSMDAANHHEQTRSSGNDVNA